ncbi:helix-turn-helix transcriptional regulator [Rhodobacter capsulatus]|uniref:Helix-turn-helix transcriptional regulator n=1 Tax=Rhodobacter capsulatus TaxID=1061 RepID=A0A4U1K318_RHOCA|nr:helix-turn-helix transcriptional regulator [Rhodobacter capsulatus]TKD26447.1 helix-turn-helix transcriptional regulator [Rhodobacter capsulatus]
MTPTEFHEARQKLGLTQAELGERTGYSRTQITRIEAGKTSAVPAALALAVRAMLQLGADPEKWSKTTTQ